MSSHLHADKDWHADLQRERARRAAGGTHFPECGPARKPLPRRSRWQKLKDAVARWRQK